jgi:hypothetical protein
MRIKTVAAVDAGIEGFRGVVDALTKARTAESLAATRLTAATESWEKQVEKTYGALVAELGRIKAERFFPRVRGKKTEVAGADGGGEKAPKWAEIARKHL